MGRYLKCHTGLVVDNGRKALTKGKEYPVLGGDADDNFLILDDSGDEHTFSKQKDENGVSYKTWFELKEG